MRQRVCFRIVRLAAAEILLQAGFEKSSEDALNTLTDIFCYSIEKNFEKIKAMQYLRFGAYKIPLSFFVYTKCFNLKSYRQKEIEAFVSYQSFLSSYMREKFKVEGENLLQMLKVLPQRKIKLEILNRQYKANLREIKSDVTESKDIEVDDFMVTFLEKAAKEVGGEVGNNQYEDYADLSNDMVKATGVPILMLEEDVYERFLISKRKSFYNHFKEEDIIFTSKITDEFTVLGKKIIEKKILEDTDMH